jgi:hypothetical protein
MAIINSYPTVTPTGSDLIIGTDVSVEGNPTKTFTIASINAIATAPDVITTKVSITDAQIQTLGTSNIEVIPVQSGQAIQIIAAAITTTGGVIGQNYTFTGGGVLSTDPGSGVATIHKSTFPINTMNAIGGAAVANFTGGETTEGAMRKGGSLTFGTSDDANPTNSGTANGGCDLYITYKILS